MPTIDFTRNSHFKQNTTSLQSGFLCIELLQALLILGVLLLLVSAFCVLSVHWQTQAIKRFEALDLLASELAGASCGDNSKKIERTSLVKRIEMPEFLALCGKPVFAEQKIVSASWRDERGKTHTIRMIS